MYDTVTQKPDRSSNLHINIRFDKALEDQIRELASFAFGDNFSAALRFVLVLGINSRQAQELLAQVRRLHGTPETD